MRNVSKLVLSLTMSGMLALSACSTESIADNTGDAAIFVGKTAVKGVVGAGKLAVRGTKAGIAKARESVAERSDFPAGTAVCENANGGYYQALVNEAGEAYCLAKVSG